MAVTQLRRPRSPVRDPSLPHQIVLHFTSVGNRTGLIAVSCNCRRKEQGWYPLEVRGRWEPQEALAAYRAHLPGGTR